MRSGGFHFGPPLERGRALGTERWGKDEAFFPKGPATAAAY